MHVRRVAAADREQLPLIAIMAAATTRNVKNIKLKKLALFRVGRPIAGCHSLSHRRSKDLG